MMFRSKNLTIFVSSLIILGLAFLILNYYEREEAPTLTACTADAMICPDGSAVGIIGPNCEFAPCPSPAPEVNSFEECVEAGNPVMESYPRQCRHNDQHFVEVIEEPIGCTEEAKACPDGSFVSREGPNCEFAQCPDVTTPPRPDTESLIECDLESRMAEACIEIYQPVCGLVEVQCVTTPCNPIPETFGNSCHACMNQNVIGYTEGSCEAEEI